MRTLSRLCALMLIFAAPAAGARTFEEIKQDGKIIVASEGAFPPFNFFQGPKLSGFEIDLAEALARKMGVAIEWRALSFDALLAGLRQDRWDLVIASFGVTPERAKAVTFTDPHYCSGGIIVTRDPALRSVKDLAGDMALCGLNTVVKKALRILSLDDVFKIAETVDEGTAKLVRK